MGARPAGAAALARARSAFLGAEPFDPAAVRAPILASWSRSKARAVPVDGLSVPYRPDLDPETPLARAAARVLGELDDALGAEPVSLVLCDGAGTVLRRRTGDARLERALDRVQLAPGFVYAEQHVGTNGIGTSLASGEPARVFGHEHFAENLEHLACAAAPVRHPLTGEVAGVVNLTCREPDAGALLLTTVTTLARHIREALLDEAGRRERALLDGFLAACRSDDTPAPVLAVGGDVVLLNRQAREVLGPAEQSLLLAEAMAAMSTGRADVVVDLPDGQRARVRCTPTSGALRDGDVVLQVQLADPRVAVLSSGPADVRPAGRLPADPMAACRAALRQAGTGWVALTGEAGAGCTHLALAGGPARLLDAAEAQPDAVLSTVVAGNRLVLKHVDRMSAPALRELTARLAEVAEGPQRAQVVVTAAPLPRDPAPALVELLALFGPPVAVPPLRARRAELPALASALLAEVGGGRRFRLSPEALRVLAALPWPGNVAQLRQVLAAAARARPSGAVSVTDLPPELVALARRPLTPLEALERDALMTALARAHGSKDAAARALGISRATVYRRVRQLGLSTRPVDL